MDLLYCRTSTQSGRSAVPLDDRGTPFRRRRATALQSAKSPFHVAGKAQTLDRANLLKARKTDSEAFRLSLAGATLSLLAFAVFGFPLLFME